jgi:allantoate deiminase
MQEGIRIFERCNELALLSEDTDALTRVYLSAQHQQANQLAGAWMRDAGMQVWQDAVGNICGRYEGTEPEAPALLLGSHLDTVRNAGKYDGMLGVITAIELVSRLHQQNKRFHFAIEVVGFGDEEGVRFGVTLLGSRGLAEAGVMTGWINKTAMAFRSLRLYMILVWYRSKFIWQNENPQISLVIWSYTLNKVRYLSQRILRWVS